MKKILQFSLALGTAFLLTMSLANAQCAKAKSACCKSKAAVKTAQVESTVETPAPEAKSNTNVIKVSQAEPAPESPKGRVAGVQAVSPGKGAGKKGACCSKSKAKSCHGAKASAAAPAPAGSATATKEQEQ